MQNANILNLPENYTMKYCQSLSLPRPVRKEERKQGLDRRPTLLAHRFVTCRLARRSLPRPHMASAELRR
jgi:hypothetical protein